MTASLTGRLLVATPALRDPNFLRTVVLVLDHDDGGTLGVVLNQPSEVPVAAILAPWSAVATAPEVVFRGGPVAPDSALGLVRLTGDASPLGVRRVLGEIGLVDLDAPPEVLAAEVSALRIFAGHAGWAPGQLEVELREGAWYTAEAATTEPFTAEPRSMWRDVLRRQRGELAFVATFPDDPSLN